MSTSIRISYERPEELEVILRKLAPWVEKAKVAKVRPGEYRRCYLTMKALPKDTRRPN